MLCSSFSLIYIVLMQFFFINTYWVFSYFTKSKLDFVLIEFLDYSIYVGSSSQVISIVVFLWNLFISSISSDLQYSIKLTYLLDTNLNCEGSQTHLSNVNMSWLAKLCKLYIAHAGNLKLRGLHFWVPIYY